MRVAVVGAGGAGLTAAWLLEEVHDVTLFEQDDRLGGHAHTIPIDVDGDRFGVDAGFQFFGPGAGYATFHRLLDALDVPRRVYPATMTLFGAASADQPERAVALPPVRGGAPVWSSLAPRSLDDMIRFRRFLAAIPAFLERHDTQMTIGEYVDRQRLPTAFTEGFLFPVLLAFWCVEPARFRQFAAYNALFYLGENVTPGWRSPAQLEIEGGIGAYVDALVATLQRAEVRTGAGVQRIMRAGDGFEVVDATGIRRTFDHVVLATNARQASGLLASLPDLEARAAQLGRIEYFDTTIAVHGDRRLMPLRESAWSVVNIRWDGTHSHLSIWNPTRRVPVFRSWVSFDERMPDNVYATARYEHGAITPDYFAAQERLRSMQGEHRVWLAGLYSDDVDSHGSAIRSAVTVAQRLAPGSRRLALLSG